MYSRELISRPAEIILRDGRTVPPPPPTFPTMLTQWSDAKDVIYVARGAFAKGSVNAHEFLAALSVAATTYLYRIAAQTIMGSLRYHNIGSC